MKSEAIILREIILAASSVRLPSGAPACVVWRQQVGTFTGPSGHVVKVGLEGMADIGGILCNGRCLQIEVKSDAGRVSDAQKRWGRMILDMGGLWFVARSADEVARIVREAL